MLMLELQQIINYHDDCEKAGYLKYLVAAIHKYCLEHTLKQNPYYDDTWQLTALLKDDVDQQKATELIGDILYQQYGGIRRIKTTEPNRIVFTMTTAISSIPAKNFTL